MLQIFVPLANNLRANLGGWIPIYIKPGAIIGDGDRKRGVHAKPSKKTNVLFLAKIAPPSTS